MLSITKTVKNYSNYQYSPCICSTENQVFFMMYFVYWKTWINPDLSRKESGDTRKQNIYGGLDIFHLF